MDQMRFPKRQADGSFCIDVVMSIETTDSKHLGVAIQEWWTHEWMQSNRTWTREWSSGDVQKLPFDHEFVRPPEVVRCVDSDLRFRLRGRPGGRWWKDWLVSKIIPDLRRRFPEVGEFLEFRECD